MGEFVTDGHLGGYVAGGDPDTWYPNLWTWLIAALSVERVIDVGCGDGATVDWFVSRGVEVFGLDGVEQEDHPLVVEHDYTEGPYPHIWGADERGEPLTPPGIDLIWSCEFVEHVEAQYVDNFLATFQLARYVAMTHALPGQPGWHHVNCQDSDYWVEQLGRYGMILDPHLTAQARAVASTDPAVNNYFARSGLVFERST